MPGFSILFDRPQGYIEEKDSTNVPSFFMDLNLDQIFASMIRGRDEYNLQPLFSIPMHDVEGINYRQEIMRDLEGPLRVDIKQFARSIAKMRQHLHQVEQLRYDYQKASWFLDAVAIYCTAVTAFVQQLSVAKIKSRGFLSFRKYLTNYTNSEEFTRLLAETQKLEGSLASVRYLLHIRSEEALIEVSSYEEGPSYGTEIEETFNRFRQGAAKDYRVTFYNAAEVNHVEASILNLVAALYPEIFRALLDYYDRNKDYYNQIIRRFDREIQFYLADIEMVDNLKKVGLNFCYPKVSDSSKEVEAYDACDLALALKFAREGSKVIVNDFFLKGAERIMVISGPNQGGKTTFARMFGQMHYLASLGFQVPASRAQLFLFDHMFTHFEREEHLENLRGKLQDELIRMHNILNQSTGNSILIMNESFASTSLKDAIYLGRETLQQIVAKDMLCVYVTFIEELSTLSEKMVSMVSNISTENPALRTFKITRRRADGRAYAIAIAQKYGLTYDALKARVKQ